jgi:hypothetical protein
MSKPEWKILQEIYHRLNVNFTDDASNFDIEINDDIINNAVKYFKQRDIGYIWPAKSYMVGICYAKWLSKEFGGNPLDYLSDPELLYNNDPYFKSYDDDSDTYNKILDKIGSWDFDESAGVVPDVRQYFIKEFDIKK